MLGLARGASAAHVLFGKRAARPAHSDFTLLDARTLCGLYDSASFYYNTCAFATRLRAVWRRFSILTAWCNTKAFVFVLSGSAFPKPRGLV